MKEGFTMLDTLLLKSDFSELGRMQVWLDAVCESLVVEEDKYGNVLVSVTEAVNNAIMHGNVGVTDADVVLTVGQSPTQFAFSVKDMGRGFDYGALPDPTAPENILKENGRGVFLMRSLADDVQFMDNGCHVSLYFDR